MLLLTQGHTQHIEGSREGQVLGCGGHGEAGNAAPLGLHDGGVWAGFKFFPWDLPGVSGHITTEPKLPPSKVGTEKSAPLPTGGGGRAL